MGYHVERPKGSQGALPTIPIGEVKQREDSAERWLVEELWSSRAVGVLGGPPKSAKTWLAVDIAVSVASSTPALERYAVKEPGTVLFFAAEDDPLRLKERFSAIAQRRGLELRSLDVRLLDVALLRLDEEKDQGRLAETIASVGPKLLVLDPLVRMHNRDENSASEISGVLSFLRHLQRHYGVAILLVHHARKQQGAGGQPGQGLRGSSDIHAWGDSNLYLHRKRADILLTVEHRSARAPDPFLLRLSDEPLPHLEVISAESTGDSSADLFRQEVYLCLKNASGPLRLEDLRGLLSARKQRIVEALRELVEVGAVERSTGGFLCREPVDSD